MFHLFNRVYLDHHHHINSRNESIILSQKTIPHPLSAVLNADFGEIRGFEEYLSHFHDGNLENFWMFLEAKDPKRRFIVYCDSELFINLVLQFIKSLYVKYDTNHISSVYESYRQDHELKTLLLRDRGDRLVSSYKGLFKKFDQPEFEKTVADVPIIGSIQSIARDKFSYEHILADYFAEPNSEKENFLKQRVLFLSWRKWCNEVKSLKHEVIKVLPDIHTLFPQVSFKPGTEPHEFCLNTPELAWLFDQKFEPEYHYHITKTYDKEFFSKIHIHIERNIWRHTFNDDSFFEKAMPGVYKKIIEALYASDYKTLLFHDARCGQTSEFFKGDPYYNVNHILLNRLYKTILKEDNRSLLPYRIS